MPKATIDKREYWLDKDTRFRVMLDNGYAYIRFPYQTLTDSSITLQDLKKLWEVLELVANDLWKPQPAKE